MKRRAWYAPEGLRFSCLPGCARCCSGEPGVVYLDEERSRRLARFLGIDEERFRRDYCRRVGFNRWSLRERSNSDCVFLDPQNSRCAVYPERPEQCRSYPFWPHVIAERASWEAERQYCPGIGKGRLFLPGEIRRRLAEGGMED